MKEVIEKSILVRSVCNELYEQGILNVKASNGIQCTREFFKKLVDHAGNFELEKREYSDYPYETTITIYGANFFAIWGEEELLETFPNIYTTHLQVQ